MKEHRSKPAGRLKDKPMVEVSSARRTEKVVVDASSSASNAKQFESGHRKSCATRGVSSTPEDSKSPTHRLENVSLRVLPDRALARTCAHQDKTVSRSVGPEKTASRLHGFEKTVSKPKLDVASRFEDKFPHKQSVFNESSSRSENKLPHRTSRNEECITNPACTLERPLTRPNASQETSIIRSSIHERSSRQEEPQRRTHQEMQMKDQSHQQKTKVIQKDKTMETCMKGQAHSHQKQPFLFRDKPTKKCELVQSKNGLIHLHEGNDRHGQLQAHSQRPKSHVHDRTLGIHDKLSPKQTISTPRCIEDERVAEDQAYREMQRLQSQPREFQEPRERVSEQRHEPHIRETPNSREQAPFQWQHLPERLVTAQEHETKLIQRQQYLQEKVRSRKMLLGSVISSDMTFSSEACRNWQSATMLSYRYREEKSFKHVVLSADSGVSMGEGSCASRRNSETETDDQVKDDLPTIIAEVGEIVNRRVPAKCQKCQRTRSEMKDASSQHSHPPSETESPPSSPCTESISSAKIESTALDVMSPPPTDRIYQCRVIRDKNTYGTMFYPVYRMYLERDGRPELLLLTARKRKKCSTSKYLICTGNDELRRKSSSLVGKLRSNLVGTRFHLATYVKGSESDDDHSRPESPYKIDSLLLFYETNFLGTKGPRRMKVFLPQVGRADDQLNLLERVRDGSMDGVLTLVNKEPEWDRETLSHILYFEGRVTKSSVKNFQLVEPPDQSTVLLQFGKIGRNEFTLDYHPPINAVQAFAIALSSFDGKIACE